MPYELPHWSFPQHRRPERPMTLAKLDVTNLRNIESASLEPSPRINFILGANGSGKTALLEAIHILGRARSFRSNQAGQVIRFQQEHLQVVGQLRQAEALPGLPVGVRLSRRGREIHLGGEKSRSSAELIRAFPVLPILPASGGLLEGAPKQRRQFLDWGAFYFDAVFLEHWRAYVRALNQRNALLRAGSQRNIEIWNHELSRYGTMIALAREAYVEKLRPYCHAAVRHFLGEVALELNLSTGWNPQQTLEEALRQELALDLRDGHTHSGPHKGDFSIIADGRAAKHYFSRGQSKLLVFALLLAQAHLLEECLGVQGCVLIDDLASELDSHNRGKLLQFIHLRQGQFFITSTEPPTMAGIEDAAVFQLEHGQVTRV